MNDMVENIASEAKEMDLNVVEMPAQKKGIKVNKSYALGFISGVCSTIAARIVAKRIAAKIAARKKKIEEVEEEDNTITSAEVEEME